MQSKLSFINAVFIMIGLPIAYIGELTAAEAWPFFLCGSYGWILLGIDELRRGE